MRRAVEVIWLEDNPRGRAHEKRFGFVESAIENKGYECNIELVSSLEQAREIFSNKSRRVDFFISDYNLGDGETGLQYLTEVRNQGLYKQFFVLYSNNDYQQILDDIIDTLGKAGIELMSNFTFISLSSTATEELDFENAVEISLSRWDELNAIRGLYMCEHAELERLLRVKFSVFDEGITYKDLFYRLKNFTTPTYKNMYKNIFGEWKSEIELRNLLAHTSEEFDADRGFCIKSKVNEVVVIYEDELDERRASLKELKEKIIFLIKNPNRPFPNHKVLESVGK